MEHLTFDEIVRAIYAEEYTPENARLVDKVNRHVMNCPECDAIHKAVYEIYELGFEEGLDVVNERLKQLEDNHLFRLNYSEPLKNYITKISLSIQNCKKIILNNIMNLSNINYYYSYPVALATRGGEQKIDVTKLIDDDNVDNSIEYNDGKLLIRLSKTDFENNNMKYPSIDISCGDKLIYSGSMEEEDERLFKLVDVHDVDNISVDIWEEDE